MKNEENPPTEPAAEPAKADREAHRAAFEPPVNDPKVAALLKGLGPAMTPPPMEVRFKEGELTTPEPNVVLDLRTPANNVAPNRASAGKVEGTVDTTFKLKRGTGSKRLLLAVAGVVAVGGFVVALTNMRGTEPSTIGTPSATRPLPATEHVAPTPEPPPPATSTVGTEAPALSGNLAPPLAPVRSGVPPVQHPAVHDPRKPADLDPGTNPF